MRGRLLSHLDLRMGPPVGLALLVVVILVSVPINPESSGTPLVLATTTSTYDTGLLDLIIPDFEKRYDCDVKVIAVGTGQALRLGEAGDADVLLVHSPDHETEFVEAGHGMYRRQVMYNGFVIVGPRDDRAGIADAPDATIALERIEVANTVFCSRGDDSGTHSRERELWTEAGHEYVEISSRGNSDWYLSLGKGMGDTLRMASYFGGYTLSDEGTFYTLEDDLDLVVLVSGGVELRNQYSVIPINGSQHTNVEEGLAGDFADWMVSQKVQEMIDGYTKLGRPLFSANAGEV